VPEPGCRQAGWTIGITTLKNHKLKDVKNVAHPFKGSSHLLNHPRGWQNVDPEHWLGGGGVWLKAEKKIVTQSIFIANWVAEQLPMLL